MLNYRRTKKILKKRLFEEKESLESIDIQSAPSGEWAEYNAQYMAQEEAVEAYKIVIINLNKIHKSKSFTQAKFYIKEIEEVIDLFDQMEPVSAPSGEWEEYNVSYMIAQGEAFVFEEALPLLKKYVLKKFA